MGTKDLVPTEDEILEEIRSKLILRPSREDGWFPMSEIVEGTKGARETLRKQLTEKANKGELEMTTWGRMKFFRLPKK